jgi:hypothetical protein
MRSSNSTYRARGGLKVATAAFLLACLLVDFLPHHGPPDFRYTGSDPAIAVWNLGWPLAWFIYDPRYGFQVGPLAYLMLTFQFVLLAGGVIVVMAIRRWRDQKRRRRGFEVVSTDSAAP